MRIETLSVFPHTFDSVMHESIMRRAQDKDLLEFASHDLRDWTHDVHRTTDDAPYGGGPGLLMKVEPIFEALDELLAEEPALVIFTTPTGEPFNQSIAEELSHEERLLIVCGHYEGFDERALTLADRCISVGDFVLTGGELPAMIIADAVTRLIPGVLGDDMSSQLESFSDGLLEYPQYTRPASYRGLDVPEILLSGDHAKVDAWRRQKAIEKTAALRPEMLEYANLTDEEREYARRLVDDPFGMLG
ncbi:MAG: tRNA (guanosine(37)-N1)-methyltransferase TrmD [bacterium]|nr:tRNA (guanosine(37)-N1)-methyltransferase TrmD [bacterium]